LLFKGKNKEKRSSLNIQPNSKHGKRVTCGLKE